jgi:hypothetical protein
MNTNAGLAFMQNVNCMLLCTEQTGCQTCCNKYTIYILKSKRLFALVSVLQCFNIDLAHFKHSIHNPLSFHRVFITQ